MKTTRSLLFIAIVLALTAAAGCAATPQDRWFQQRDALNTANRIYLAHVPVMNDEQVVHYGELLRAARAEPTAPRRVHLRHDAERRRIDSRPRRGARCRPKRPRPRSRT